MKKITLAVITVLSFGFANAQGVKFGAKAALNVASLTGDVDNVSSLVGFQIGAFAEFKLSDKFAFQPESPRTAGDMALPTLVGEKLPVSAASVLPQ